MFNKHVKAKFECETCGARFPRLTALEDHEVELKHGYYAELVKKEGVLFVEFLMNKAGERARVKEASGAAFHCYECGELKLSLLKRHSYCL